MLQLIANLFGNILFLTYLCRNKQLWIMISLESKVIKDDYTQFIQDAYDLKVEDTCKVEIPCSISLETLGNSWNVGLIVGASGSGKSTILRKLGGDGGGANVSFDSNIPLLSNFSNMTPSEATKLLCAMGLSSVPTWLRPFNVLSNGEQYRATMAMQIARAKEGDIVYIDEFTSVVDRNVAKAMSNSLQKYARRNNIKVILASCHYDIIDWLQCDWLYDLNKGGALERGDYLRQGRPQISLQMYRVEPSAWRVFAKHHYMTQELNDSSACYVFSWGTQLVAFVGVLPMPSGTIKNAVRGTRTVVLPDFQGMGIGSKVTSFIASIYKNCGYRYYTKTVNPALGEYRNKSKDWKATGFNGKRRENGLVDKNGRHYLSRISYCHEYVGSATQGFDDLIRPIDKMRYDKSMEGQLSLF